MKTIRNVSSLVLMAAAEAAKGGGTAAVQNSDKTTAVNPAAVTTTGPYKVNVENQPGVAELVKDENLSKKDLKIAYQAVFAAYDIQWKKGGIEDTQNLLKGLQGKVGEQVFTIAKAAMDHCKGYSLAVVRLYFLALCSKAEEALKSKHIEEKQEEKPVSQLVPLWATYKTAIAKGLERGIDPYTRNEESNALLFPTASLYRGAVQELEAKERGSNDRNDGNGRNDEKQTTTALQLVVKGWAPRVSAAMNVLCQSLNGLTHEQQDKFADKILILGNEIAEFRRMSAPSAGEIAAAKAGASLEGSTEQDMDVGAKAALQEALDKDEAAESRKGNKGHRKTKAA